MPTAKPLTQLESDFKYLIILAVVCPLIFMLIAFSICICIMCNNSRRNFNNTCGTTVKFFPKVEKKWTKNNRARSFLEPEYKKLNTEENNRDNVMAFEFQQTMLPITNLQTSRLSESDTISSSDSAISDEVLVKKPYTTKRNLTEESTFELDAEQKDESLQTSRLSESDTISSSDSAISDEVLVKKPYTTKRNLTEESTFELDAEQKDERYPLHTWKNSMVLTEDQIHVTQFRASQYGFSNERFTKTSFGLRNFFEGRGEISQKIRSDEVMCQANVKKNGYQVVCTSEKMFPRGLCQFVVKNNEKLLELSTNDIEYRYNEVFGRKVYYDTQCSLLIINSRINRGYYDVTMTMYPNVSGSNEDVKYGTNGSLSFNVAEPEVSLDACNSIVEEGALVECTCVTFGRVIIVKVSWMEGDNTITNNDNCTLRFIARRNSAVFYCMAKNQFGLQSERLTYEPFIFSKSDLMTCSLMMDDDNVNISCTVLKVYPAASCIFNIQSNATNFLGNVAYDHATRPGVPIYYDTECRFTSSRTDLQPGQYTVQVTSFPTINNSKSINSYSTTQLLHFSIQTKKTIEPENPSIPENKTNYIILVIVFTTVFLMLLGCLSCLASCILRRTKSSNPTDIRQSTETRLSMIATVNSDEIDYILDYDNNVHAEPPLDLIASSSRSLQHPQPGIQHKVYIGPIDVNVSVDTAKPQTSATDCTVSQDSIDGIDLMGVSFNNGHSSDDDYISPIDDDSSSRSILSDGPIYDTTGGASTTDQMYDFAASGISSEAIYEGLSHEDSLK
ncbi:hypothetical protein Btru_009305 [Bulinus truncatus]|nr:hypothetical protein Btru_009305 [Bulinus truncatus]